MHSPKTGGFEALASSIPRYTPSHARENVRALPPTPMSVPAGRVPRMARIHTTYRCSECGWTTPKWVGRCA
ncbi:hypothetical protein, partial [Clavibacter michiganensis]|uniref:hypothetical protein n=1 Tax=Clavibacter michiganensis TaxID=28447 RepID=UPI00311F59A3